MQHGLVVGNLLEFFCCFVRMAGLLVHCFKLPLCVSRSLLMHKCGRPGSIAVFRNLTMKSFFKKKKQSESMSTASTAIDNTKTDYEKELERFIKQEKYVPYYGFDANDPGYDRIMYKTIMYIWVSVLLTFIPAILLYAPDFFGKMKAWTRREAVLRLEERMAKGEPVIDPNFVPANVIESMVPPEGDWEEEWLRAQPSVRSDTKSKFYTQVSP